MKAHTLAAALVLMLPSFSFSDDKDAIPKVTAFKLKVAYYENEAFADETYTDKELQVTVAVGRIVKESRSVEPGKLPNYILEIPGDSGLPVKFLFPGEERKKLSQLKGGQAVTIVAQCRGKKRGREGKEEIRFDKCKIVSPDSPPSK